MDIQGEISDRHNNNNENNSNDDDNSYLLSEAFNYLPGTMLKTFYVLPHLNPHNNPLK